MQEPVLKSYGIAAVLLLIPVLIVEFLLGAIGFDVVKFPPALLVLTIHYGAGAVLIRELARRWRKRLASILLLGAVYGVFNEGLDSGGFFEANFYTFAGFGSQNFGSWAGVNIEGALTITVVHAIFTIALPIIIVDALFPNYAQRRLLGDKALTGLYVLYVAATAIIILHRQPPINPFGLVLVTAATVFLTLTAEMLPSPRGSASQKTPTEATLFLIGFFGAFAWLLLIPKVLSSIHAPTAVHVMTTLALISCVFWLFLRLPDISDHRSLAFAAGAEAPFLAHAVTSGLFVPAAVTLLLLVAARRRSGDEIARPRTLLGTMALGLAGLVAAVLTTLLLERIFS
jgi:hypothetical protein